MLIDTHAHLNSLGDTRKVITECIESNVTEVISVSTDITSSIHNIKIANEFDEVYSAVGIHPCDIGTLNLMDLDKIEELSIDSNKNHCLHVHHYRRLLQI